MRVPLRRPPATHSRIATASAPTPFAMVLLSGIVSAMLTACGGSPVATEWPQSAADVDNAPPEVQQVEPIRVIGYTIEELSAKFERARSLLLVEQYAKAAPEFDQLMRLAEEPRLQALSQYNSGLAYTGMAQHDRAIARYRGLLKDHPKHPIAKHGAVRLSRLLGYLERWQELEDASKQLLLRTDLALMDRIEGYGGQALALVEQGKRPMARKVLAKALAIIDKHGFGTTGAPPIQLAQVSFAEGELRRLDSEEIKLNPTPDNFAQVLEARCQGLLDAQSSYTDAMRSRDAHWAAMSGYRVGQLYQRLHAEATAIPAPAGATLKQQQLFQAAMRLRYRILLEKGLRMMAGTVGLGERTGAATGWVARAREAKRQLEQALEDEKTILKGLPYSEDEIQAALDKLKTDKLKTAKP